MINFIVCDDEKEIVEKVKIILMKIAFQANIEYKIHAFNSYDESFMQTMNSNLENKIYILDIEVEDSSGLEVAKQIREKDWKSIIIILTAHYELETLAYKSKILLLDFISKYELYDEKIYNIIKLCIERKLNDDKLKIKTKNGIERIDYIDLYLGSLLNMMFCVIIVKKVFGIKMIDNKRKITIVLLVSSLLSAVINVLNKDVFKIVITLPVYSLCIKEIFDLRIGKSIIYFLITVFYLLIGEIITGVVFSVLKYEYQFTSNYILGRSFGNVAVIIFATPFLYFKHLTKLVVNIANKINFDSKKSRIGIIFFVVVVSALGYKSASKVQDLVSIIMNVITYISIILVIYLLYKEQQKSKEIEENYNALFTYLEKYEKEIVEKRKIIHDYKNQLIVINGYIDDKVKLKEYISEIIKEQKSVIDNKMVRNIDKLPSGLKGLVYYKLANLDNKILVDLSVSGEIKKFNNIEPKKSKDILKIIGVLLDNAIEAVENADEKYIELNFDIKNNKLKFELLNSYKGNVTIKNVLTAGFSTKGNNRGYGIPLIKDIVNKNKDFELDLKTKDNIFTAILNVEN